MSLSGLNQFKVEETLCLDWSLVICLSICSKSYSVSGQETGSDCWSAVSSAGLQELYEEEWRRSSAAWNRTEPQSALLPQLRSGGDDGRIDRQMNEYLTANLPFFVWLQQMLS